MTLIQTIREFIKSPVHGDFNEDAINMLCALVQAQVGQTDGGPASLFWSDEAVVKEYQDGCDASRFEIILKYVQHELAYLSSHAMV